jgi:hypothetical protein
LSDAAIAPSGDFLLAKIPRAAVPEAVMSLPAKPT